jgi:hypothetical protein
MKVLWMLALPFVAGFTFNVATAAEHEEKVEVKSNDDGKEFKMKVHRKGKDYVGVSGEKEYILRGEPTTTIRTDGDYTVRGTVSTDGRYIETRRVEPVVTEKTTEKTIEVNR